MLFNLCLFKKTIYPGRQKKKPGKIFKKINKYFKMYLKVHYKRILRIGRIDHISLFSGIGVEDACLTAIASGSLYSIYGSVLGVLSSYISIRNVNLQVRPVYNKFYFDIDLNSILKIKKANAIKEIIRFLIFIIKKKLEVLKNERSSDKRSYEHGYAKH